MRQKQMDGGEGMEAGKEERGVGEMAGFRGYSARSKRLLLLLL